MPPNPTTQQNIIERLGRIEKELEDITKILRGANGGTGLLSSVQALAKEVKDHVNEEYKCPIRDVATILYGSRDEADKRGLIGDVEDLKKWRAELRRWYVLFIGAIIVGVVNIMLSLIQH